MDGDRDLASVAALVGERARARVLLALGDGRALPASVLAAEAGVAASTASAHLTKLVAGKLLSVEAHGRHRYYRLAGPAVAEAVEALGRIASARPVRSLREGTRAHALRAARLCYDHLAGRVGVALMAALLERGVLEGGDGRFHSDAAGADHLAAPGRACDYRLTDDGAALLRAFGVDAATLGGSRPLVRYCIDWTEQQHHLSGALGAALAQRLLALGWLRRAPTSRVVVVTDDGREGLLAAFGVDVGAGVPAARAG